MIIQLIKIITNLTACSLVQRIIERFEKTIFSFFIHDFQTFDVCIDAACTK